MNIDTLKEEIKVLDTLSYEDEPMKDYLIEMTKNKIEESDKRCV